MAPAARQCYSTGDLYLEQRVRRSAAAPLLVGGVVYPLVAAGLAQTMSTTPPLRLLLVGMRGILLLLLIDGVAGDCCVFCRECGNVGKVWICMESGLPIGFL